MYINAQFRAAKLPTRSPDPQFSARPLASSLVVHALLAVGLIVLAHRAILRTPEETPPIPMVFLPPEPAPVAPAPPKQAEPPAPAPPVKVEQPPPPPIPQVAPLPPPPVVHEARPIPKPHVERPVRMRRERHEPRIERPVERRPRHEPREVYEPPPMPDTEQPMAASEPAPVRRYAPPAIETGPLIPPRPLSEASGNRPPDYPSSLRARGVQGLVLLRVYVTADGRAASVSIMRSSGSERLDQSAASAVRGWRFLPATRGGHPIPGVAEVPVNFHLSG